MLSDHYDSSWSARNGAQRTYLGELLYSAKYGSDRRALEILTTAVIHCVRQLRQMPPRTDGLATVTSVAAVPCHPPKLMSVPHAIADAAARALDVPDMSGIVVKTHATPAAKTTPRPHPEAYVVRQPLNGQRVLLVDDLYHTGATLESVAVKLRAAGAQHIVGLCVTRARKGMNP